MAESKIVLSKNDFILQQASRRVKLFNIIGGIMIVICMVWVLIEIFPLFEARFVYNMQISMKDTILMWFFLAVSLFFIVYAFGIFLMPFITRYKIRRDYKKSDRTSVIRIEFEEEGVVAKQSQQGVSAEMRYAYSIMDGYIEKSNAVYIKLNLYKSKYYLVLDDDAYLKGNREELVTFLESKEIKHLEK